MRTLTIVLDSTNVAKTIRALAALGTAIPATSVQLDIKLSHNTPSFLIYPEAGNNVDVTTGPARIGFDALIVRSGTAALNHGTPLLPGIIMESFKIAGGGAAIFNFDTTWIIGQTGDVFQIHYGHI